MSDSAVIETLAVPKVIRTARSVTCTILGHDISYLFPIDPTQAGNFTTNIDGSDCYCFCQRCGWFKRPSTDNPKPRRKPLKSVLYTICLIVLGLAGLNLTVTLLRSFKAWCVP